MWSDYLGDNKYVEYVDLSYQADGKIGQRRKQKLVPLMIKIMRERWQIKNTEINGQEKIKIFENINKKLGESLAKRATGLDS